MYGALYPKILFLVTYLYNVVVGLFWLNRDGLPPAALGPNILNKGVKISPTATQFGLACAQTMPRLPEARLQRAELGKDNHSLTTIIL